MESMEIDRQKIKHAGEEEKGIKPIIVVLMGLPGSGKSTFCEEVMRNARHPWARVCQDTINSGKGGTKIQCLSAAAAALKDGKSVLIDRCNIDREQRADFLKLGGSETEKHSVVLDLPSKLCVSRSVKRSGHEGNLQGGRAAAVVNHMVPKKELPKLSEGFNRITFCHDEREVKEAVSLYGSLGSLDSLPSGCFGQKSSDSKIQVGIMKFLKKVDAPGNAKSKPKDASIQGTKIGSDKTGDALQRTKKNDELDITSTSGSTASHSIPTLAFPSISTADFQFNLEKASDIIVEKVEEYIGKIGKARLVLVDLSRGSKILSLVKTKAAKKNLDGDKFSTFVGDITQLLSQGGLHCNVIANAANWRLKPGGGGVNAAIYKAAGSELETATKERAATLRPGKSVVVPLPSSSPLFPREGVTHVIHVLGPNMNPQRPDCLKDDYAQGCEILREAYSSLFEGFVSIVKSHGVVSKHNNVGLLEFEDLEEKIPNNEDQNGKREAVYKPENNKKSKVSQHDLKHGVNKQNEVKGGNTAKTWGSWAQALYDIAMHPENHKNVVLDVSDDVVVINDAYPKAQKHILVVARPDGLDSIADVRGEHISLLKKIHAVGLKWAEKFILENKSLSFRMGYHSVPSMRQLHLHVISQDFDSSHLKNKKHWNSFNTPFFLDSVDVMKELKEVGNVTLKNDKLLAMELRCHRCRSAHPNMPRLKSHISSCRAPVPASLLENGRLISSEGNSS